MVDVGKREDRLLDAISTYVRNRDAALGLIEEFCLADPTLWPILREIQLQLTSSAPVRGRITEQVEAGILV